MNNKTIARLDCEIPEGTMAEIRPVRIEERPRYYKVGNGKRNTFMKKKYEPIDAVDAMSVMTPQELWTLKLVKDNLILIEERVNGKKKYRTSCKAVILSAELTDGEKQKLKTGFKRLQDKGLVRRVKRQHYMLNPNFLIPHYYEEEMELYTTLPGSEW